ncbi:hypothetical protein [Methylobacterium sp. UNC378MF]|nr:hypothetical protein [Methylobacterium sp. UNC378MF]
MTHDDIGGVGDTSYDAEAAAKAGLGTIGLCLRRLSGGGS